MVVYVKNSSFGFSFNTVKEYTSKVVQFAQKNIDIDPKVERNIQKGVKKLENLYSRLLSQFLNYFSEEKKVSKISHPEIMDAILSKVENGEISSDRIISLKSKYGFDFKFAAPLIDIGFSAYFKGRISLKELQKLVKSTVKKDPDFKEVYLQLFESLVLALEEELTTFDSMFVTQRYCEVGNAKQFLAVNKE